jgi:hypothetical protein
MNEKAMLLRKIHGGRDIVAEEMHDASGLISLSINE